MPNNLLRMMGVFILLGASLSVTLGGCGKNVIQTSEALELTSYSSEPYARVLAGTVIDGMVDYAKLREQHTGDLMLYVESLGRFGPSITPQYFTTREDELAYYINAYNAIMLYLWIQKGAGADERSSNRSVNVIWFVTERYRVDGQWMTLDYLEQKLIRPRYKEGRIHYALICGAWSCPPLLEEPYVGQRLGPQMDSIAQRWLLHWDAFQMRGNTLYLSAIMNWYAEDFEMMGGLKSQIESYLPEDHPQRQPALEAIERGRVKYLNYSWRINDIAVKAP